MKHRLLYKNFFVVLVTDILLLVLSLYLAHQIRFDFDIPHQHLLLCYRVLLIVVIIKIICFYFFDLYRGMWRFTSITDLFNIIKASSLSTLLIVSFILFSTRFQGFSRSVFIIDWCLTILFISGCRLCIRLYFEHLSEDKSDPTPLRKTFSILNRKKDGSKRLLIIGAGNAGEKIYREIRDNAMLEYNVVGFLDDDPAKIGKKIHGVPVLGYIEDINKIIKKVRADEAMIAIPSTNAQQMRRIVETCEACNVRFKTLPGLGELINGKVSIKALRDVDFLDLLGRPAVELDVEVIQKYLTQRCVLVTGAGGSIGSELCRQIVRFSPEKLILIDASETNLYDIQMELKHQVGYLEYVTILGRTQNRELINQIFLKYKPNVVFHAAAYKHVPMLERNPWEAVYNNIRGAHMVMEQSVRHKAEYFVFVSTDKAVRPTNVMGASKRVCELVLQSFTGNATRMMAVRFGNVTGSSGSVIPLFRKQIVRGGPVTVTHPEITRYFMTIQEASQLILQAGALGEGGEVFILEMGTPVKIADMARDLIRLSGKDPDRDIEITYTGLRPGEKLHEELISEGEGVVTTSHDKILVLRTSNQWNGMKDQATFRKWLMQNIEELYKIADAHDSCGIMEKLKEIVPEYEASDSECVI